MSTNMVSLFYEQFMELWHRCHSFKDEKRVSINIETGREGGVLTNRAIYSALRGYPVCMLWRRTRHAVACGCTAIKYLMWHTQSDHSKCQPCSLPAWVHTHKKPWIFSYCMATIVYVFIYCPSCLFFSCTVLWTVLESSIKKELNICWIKYIYTVYITSGMYCNGTISVQ